MSNILLSEFMKYEESNYEVMNEYVATRLEEGILKSIVHYLKKKLAESNGADVSIELPWGTHTVSVKAVGEGTNIAANYTPSKRFLKLLNEDTTINLDRFMEDIDPEYLQDVVDFVGYRAFDPTEEIKEAASKYVVEIPVSMAKQFVNDYMQMIAKIGRDKQRAGKSYRLEVSGTYPYGAFDFEYEDGEIKVRFTPNKAFKGALKDDSIAEKMETADLTKSVAAHATTTFLCGSGRFLFPIG